MATVVVLNKGIPQLSWLSDAVVYQIYPSHIRIPMGTA